MGAAALGLHGGEPRPGLLPVAHRIVGAEGHLLPARQEERFAALHQVLLVEGVYRFGLPDISATTWIDSMGFRFRQSIRLFPGFRLNLSKRGASVSMGGRGFTTNVSSRGVRNTVSLPGTGLSYSSFTPAANQQRVATLQPPPVSGSAASIHAWRRRAITIVGGIATLALFYALLVK